MTRKVLLLASLGLALIATIAEAKSLFGKFESRISRFAG
jgi:hypothetical protein